MDPDRTHLDLRVVDWVQTISPQGSIDPAGHSLRARCSAMDDLHFAASSGETSHIFQLMSACPEARSQLETVAGLKQAWVFSTTFVQKAECG
jgi:hypothetical protein